MSFSRLRDFTVARVGLGRTGASLPVRALLDFQLAHAQARDAVHTALDTQMLVLDMGALKEGSPLESIVLHSAASDRSTYLRHPDLGRRLSPESAAKLAALAPVSKHLFDAVFIVADGLSALAVQRHAPPLLRLVLQGLSSDWNIAPVIIVEQGRVGIGDEIGERLGAFLSVVLIGERPGLSSPDSLGIYLTWNPRLGLTDAHRNCISNIHAEGLSYGAAAHKLLYLINESWRRKLSGVELKEEAKPLLEPGEKIRPDD